MLVLSMAGLNIRTGSCSLKAFFEKAESILPVTPMIAMACFVRISFINVIMQSYHHMRPRSITYRQEKALTFVNAVGQKMRALFEKIY